MTTTPAALRPRTAEDRDVAVGATGLLGTFNRAGMVAAGDVHVASTLGRLAGEDDPSVLLAAALTCRAVRDGSVCLVLAEAATSLLPESGPVREAATPAGAEESAETPSEVADALPWPDAEAWAAAVAASPLVAAGALRWEDGLLYLDRYHEQETQVLDDLTSRAATVPPHDPDLLAATLERVFPATGYEEQRAAVERAARQWTCVLTGGPGTGKTTAVAGLLVALHEQFARDGRAVRIALAAPTGKAAARLQEAVAESATGFSAEDRARLEGVTASTLHRLLGRDPGNRTRFRHHRGNRLPHDVVVVDETSMVSLTMMARLLEAVRPQARLVLVGDPDQLSSIEAGAVLGDLVEGYAERADSPVAALRTTHRFGASIGRLAETLRGDAADQDAVLEVLDAALPEVEWVRDPEAGVERIRDVALDVALRARSAALAGDAAGALAVLAEHRLLCAHRDGPYGVRIWNQRIEQWLAAATGEPLRELFYVGRPLLVTANDHAHGIWNGDSGVVVETPQGVRAVIDASDGPRPFAPSRLHATETMHALTIHKSQGGQADQVTVLLPPADSRLLTRDLLYTAVTRARSRVRLVGTEEEVRAAVARTARRATGLAPRLSREG